MGFNGIPVALLASSHPLGTIFGALFVSYIQVGGEAMQPEFVKEIIDIIIAIIIYLAAFSLLTKEIIAKIHGFYGFSGGGISEKERKESGQSP